MPPVGFEPTVSAGERPKTYALDRAANGTGQYAMVVTIYVTDVLLLCRSLRCIRHMGERCSFLCALCEF